MNSPYDIVILGLTITSSWGNGHATTYRSLVRGLAGHGHRVLFLERDAPWYAGNRDEPNPPGTVTRVYQSFDELVTRFEADVERAGLVIVGSYVPDGVRCGEWVTAVAKGRTAFYDIDTPVTLGKLESGDAEYITPALIRRYDAYFSFTGGPALRTLESRYGSPRARALYCSVDPEKYHPVNTEQQFDLGYLGTYSPDRQTALDDLLLAPARRWKQGRFAVAGPQYPESVEWPANVHWTIHLSPREHPMFYGSQRFTLNITRQAMRRAGYSPSVRLFEAGACRVPVISDSWPGLDSVFRIGREVLVAEDTEAVLRLLHDMSDSERLGIADAARWRILAEHTPEQRALQLEGYWKEMNDHVSSGQTLRNGRGRSIPGGVEAGLPSERERAGTSADAVETTVEVANSSCVHQSAGASCGDC